MDIYNCRSNSSFHPSQQAAVDANDGLPPLKTLEKNKADGDKENIAELIKAASSSFDGKKVVGD